VERKIIRRQTGNGRNLKSQLRFNPPGANQIVEHRLRFFVWVTIQEVHDPPLILLGKAAMLREQGEHLYSFE
jgi:hypothetical protein